MKFFFGFLTGCATATSALYLYFVFPHHFEYNPIAQYDMKRLCRYTAGYKWGDPKNEKDQVEKEIEYFAETRADFFWSKDAQQFFAGVPMFQAEDRWKYVQGFADGIGLKNYECPALQTYYSKPFRF